MKKLLILMVSAAVLFLPAALRTSTAKAADPVDVTVTIMRFIEVQDPDEPVLQGCCGDY